MMLGIDISRKWPEYVTNITPMATIPAKTPLPEYQACFALLRIFLVQRSFQDQESDNHDIHAESANDSKYTLTHFSLIVTTILNIFRHCMHAPSPFAANKTLSSVHCSLFISPMTLPSRMTTIRFDRLTSSGKSEEMSMKAIPCST